jgi:hypothetical protein
MRPVRYAHLSYSRASPLLRALPQPQGEICVICGLSTLYALSDPFTMSALSCGPARRP